MHSSAMEGLLFFPGCITCPPNIIVGMSPTQGSLLESASTTFLPPTYSFIIVIYITLSASSNQLGKWKSITNLDVDFEGNICQILFAHL